MYLKKYYDENGKIVYTLKEKAPDGRPTMSAHPARFSPADKYSKERIIAKTRFNIILTQKKPPVY